MAGTDLRQDNVTLNLGVGGADVATDFVPTFGTSGGHFQIVKVDFGGDGESSQVVSNNPFPVRISQINANWLTLPVGGDTQGGPIPITGTFDLATVSITVDAVTADIRSIAAGVTLSVQAPGASSITEYVKVGGTVGIDFVELPTTATFGTVTLDCLRTINFGGTTGFTCETGIKIKNFANLGGDAPVSLGFSGGSITGGTSGFLLGLGEEIFIEIDNIHKLTATSFTGGAGSTLSVLTYQAS
jgi:hypothetical protein